MRSEFIADNPPTPSAHASTIADTGSRLVAAWFGGQAEGRPDVGIWVAHSRGAGWEKPTEVARGATAGDSRLPCWNPVLHRTPGGRLLLFYKEGPSPREWWGLLTCSDDGGHTWSAAHRLPEGVLGPIKNKPIVLPNGDLLCPSSDEGAGWTVHMERLIASDGEWTRTPPLNDPTRWAAIQPALLAWPDGRIQALCRTKQGRVSETRSEDGGRTWSPVEPTSLPNPDSGIDAVVLSDGRAVLVYNPTERGRTPLCLAVSADGRAWRPGPVLESAPGEYSYPAVVQTADGTIHVTYTWRRERIKHVSLQPDEL